MCDLCSDDPKERQAAIKRHLSIAESLSNLSKDYEYLARGIKNPHTEEAKMIGQRAYSLIKILVEDWL